MPGPNLKGLIFSKNRAAQLNALLESFEVMCVDSNDVTLTVLYKVTSALHEKQYNTLKINYPNVVFYEETDFMSDVTKIISDALYVLFLVDDCICVKPFNCSEICNTLSKNNNAIGFSLRLGVNISYCYPFNCEQPKPDLMKLNDNILACDWTINAYDFGYPLEVSSSVYRLDDILLILINAIYSNPNELESILYNKRHVLKYIKPYILCYNTSRAFCNPLNIVNVNNSNRHANIKTSSIEVLAQKFNNGLKIDTTSLFNITPKSCHQEVEFNWVKQ